MAYILVAVTEEKMVVYLNESPNLEALRAMRKYSKFYCPDCSSQMVLKIGEVKIPHFAHKNLSDCGTSEGESALHIQGKILLHQSVEELKTDSEKATISDAIVHFLKQMKHE